MDTGSSAVSKDECRGHLPQTGPGSSDRGWPKAGRPKLGRQFLGTAASMTVMEQEKEAHVITVSPEGSFSMGHKTQERPLKALFNHENL